MAPCAKFLLCFCALIILGGCKSADPKAFTEFKDSLKEAGDGMEATLSLCYDSAKSGFCEEFSKKKDSKFSELMISTGDGSSWEWKDKPLFLSVKDAMLALSAMNEILYMYSELLCELASGSVSDQQRLDIMVVDLNRNMNNALKAANIKASDGAAIFSIASIEMLNLYVKEKRVEMLQQAIGRNKPCMVVYSKICLNLIRTVRANVKSSYATRMEAVSTSWNGDDPPEKRREIAETALRLDEEYIHITTKLKRMEAFYQLLPEAHDDLIIALTGDQLNIKNLKNLSYEAKRLNSQYRKLKKDNNGQ